MLMTATTILSIWLVSVAINIDQIESNGLRDKKGRQVWVQREGQRIENDGEQ